MLIHAIRILCMCQSLGFPVVANATQDLWDLWNEPGVHAIMRHATAPGYGDPDNFTVGKCNTQRNLSETGRQEARALGKIIQSKGIKPTAIYSSQWCRCLETAKELNLGKVEELPALNSFFQGRGNNAEQTTALKKHLALLKPNDKVLYVTHQVNTTGLTGVYPASGEVVLFRLNKHGQVEVVARIKPGN